MSYIPQVPLRRVRLENSDRTVLAHRLSECNGPPCTIHYRSRHHMRKWPQYWRDDRKIMERICPHGVGHPDPDDLTDDTRHGCDGCCVTPKENRLASPVYDLYHVALHGCRGLLRAAVRSGHRYLYRSGD